MATSYEQSTSTGSEWILPEFPTDFIWGTAASSTQTEGAAPASNWAVWEKLSKASPSNDGCGFGSHYEEDFSILKSLGLDHHRLSLEWARIEPLPYKRDERAVEHYSDVLRAARSVGMSIWICFHHFTLPRWFEDLGGFCNPQARNEHWKRHVSFVAEHFGDQAFGWMPINEPVAYTTGSFLCGTMPPGKGGLDSFADATVSIFEAWRDAVKVLDGSGPVATIHNLSPIIPVEDHPSAKAASQLIESVMWKVPLQAHTEGVVAIPGRERVAVKGLERPVDLFGFSYYNALAVTASRGGLGLLGSVTTYPVGTEPGPLSYHPWPDGIGLVLDRLREELPETQLLVAENGIGTRDDKAREAFLMRSLEIIGKRWQKECL